MASRTKVMEHAEKDLDQESEKELIDQVEKEQKWKRDTETIEIAEKENIEIIEWSENLEDTIEKGHEAGSVNIEDLQKTNTMMKENDTNAMKENV